VDGERPRHNRSCDGDKQQPQLCLCIHGGQSPKKHMPAASTCAASLSINPRFTWSSKTLSANASCPSPIR
jgi:hypothetical protein